MMYAVSAVFGSVFGAGGFFGTSVEVPMGILMLLFLMIALPTGDVVALARAGVRRLQAGKNTTPPASTDGEEPKQS